MRGILFRGKRIYDGEWVKGFYVNCNGPGCSTNETRHYIVEYPGECHEVYTSTVSQFTGLTDKNGKNIFEGDIVLKRTYQGKKRFPVTFSGGMFHCGYGGGSSTATHPYTLGDKQIEVVGNIYDNKELLEE